MNRKLLNSFLGLAVVAMLVAGCYATDATVTDANSVGLDAQAIDNVDGAEACSAAKECCPIKAAECDEAAKAECSSEKKEECTGESTDS